MVIGVKYCGGCNSVYDRGRQVNRLKEQFPEHEFCTASQTKACDVWLAVCGCMRGCVSTGDLEAKKRLFILKTEKSFAEVRAYLEEERKKGAGERQVSADAKLQQKKLRIGQEAEFTKTFFRDDVEKFAVLTGDHSRLHTDMEFAGGSIFGRPVVHGVLAASLISTVMGMLLPGEGTVFMEEQVRFCRPVFYGDTITARVRFVSCREGKRQYVGTFSGVCTNQRGETVVSAVCRQLMMKTLFAVENPQDEAEGFAEEGTEAGSPVAENRS